MFENPFSFEGRIRRAEFAITIIIFSLFSSFIISKGGYFSLLYIPLLWFLFAQATKREHDLGFNGWWQFIPFRYLWLIFLKGQKGPNHYGTDPK